MKDRSDDATEAAMAFESQAYPHCTPETRRLLFHARGTIVRFLDSDPGFDAPALIEPRTTP